MVCVTQLDKLLPAEAGSYVLIMTLDSPVSIKLGSLGVTQFSPGCYAYAGSAFGPGGIRARCLRHYRISKRLHWHVDYLRKQCRLEAVWFATSERTLEHEFARILCLRRGASLPVAGFGATDCNCETHLIYSATRFGFRGFRERFRLKLGPTVVLGKVDITTR